MTELIVHLEQGNVLKLYGTKYNHIVQTLYIIIRRAVRDEATTIAFELDKIVWSSNDKILGEFFLGHPIDYPNLGQLFHTEFIQMLHLDAVLNQSITEDDITHGKSVYRIVYSSQ